MSGSSSSSSSARALAMALAFLSPSRGFQPSAPRPPRRRPSEVAPLSAIKFGRNYEPKWKKQKTIAETLEEEGKSLRRPEDVGLKGTITVVFKQGNATKSSVAMPGDPLRSVATNAGQFIQYGCGKGECGTCEAMFDGTWIRPCTALVPADVPHGGEMVVQVKEVKAKAKSSGKFYSLRSFIMGFYNNLLGMYGFVRDRRKARRNWQERKEYEDSIARIIEEKRAAKRAAAAARAEAEKEKEKRDVPS